MKILVDEHIPLMTVDALRVLGHDVRDIRGTANEGATDPELWTFAQTDLRLLVTTDKGFLQYRSVAHCGILIVRLRKPNRRLINQRIFDALQLVAAGKWPGMTMVMRDVAHSTWRASNDG